MKLLILSAAIVSSALGFASNAQAAEGFPESEGSSPRSGRAHHSLVKESDRNTRGEDVPCRPWPVGGLGCDGLIDETSINELLKSSDRNTRGQDVPCNRFTSVGCDGVIDQTPINEMILADGTAIAYTFEAAPYEEADENVGEPERTEGSGTR